MNFILTINGGSSSIKFAVFASSDLERLYSGQFSRIGLANAELESADHRANQTETCAIAAPDHASCIPLLKEWLAQRVEWKDLQVVGHRIVHGGPRFAKPERVTDSLLGELEKISPYAPEHLPVELSLIRAFAAHDANVPQFVCFDTAFHRTLPRTAQMLPIPRRYFTRGVMRYGFHGLSYQYLMSELERVAGRGAARGRVILAHLGNGASMAAVREGKSVDTSMAFTPTAGLVMSTRSGDIDPGLVAYLARSEDVSPQEFYEIVHAYSGLRGISETSSDMRDLLEREHSDERAADAIAIFCRQAKKFIGAYAAVLGGLDTLIFAGGIGEKSAVIRQRICEELEFLSIEIDTTRNEANAPIISTDAARVKVRVMKTDEEVEIARAVSRMVKA